MNPLAADLLGGAVVTVLFLSIVAAAEAWRRWGRPDPESTRKLVHIAGGLVALCLPFVVRSHWIVGAMALGMAVLFLAGKWTGQLQSLHGVSRRSSGTEYYPLVIYLLFYFTQGAPVKYIISVLVLTTADSLAALIGSRYGRLRYEVDNNFKSVEGSLVFFLATFLAVLVPLLAWPMLIGPLEASPTLVACVFTALLVAFPTTGIEAIAQHGRDNLWVPLGTLLILNNTLHLPIDSLARWTLVLLTICAITGLAVWRIATFNVGATVVLILAAYACWTLTSIDWAIPFFLAFGYYLIAVLASPQPMKIASRAVVRALLPPFVVMMAAALLRHEGATQVYGFLYGPFVAGCASIAGQSAWDQLTHGYSAGRAFKFLGSIANTCLACIAAILPAQLLQPGMTWIAPLWIAAAALAVGIPSGMLVDHPAIVRSTRLWALARMGFITAALGLVALVQAAGLSPLWHPR